MRCCIAVLTCLVLLSLRTGTILAQTGNDNLPRLSFPMAATAYPMESVAANEEGTTVLEITIGTDGSIGEVELHEPTGYSLLDDAAIMAVRNASLSTPPTLPDGTPTTARALAEVIWDLPLLSAETYIPNDLSGGPPIGPGDEIVMPSARGNQNRVNARDYPRASITRREHGITAVYVLVGEDGSVLDKRLGGSSSFERLDNASLMMVENFAYNPGTINGVPSPMWAVQAIRYALSDIPSTNCHSMPKFAPYQKRAPSVPGEALVPYDRWTLINEEGVIEDSLLLTEAGWMVLVPEIVASMNNNASYQRYSRYRARPPTCWLYEGLDPMMNG